ncbi:putative FecR protein [Methylophaga frappieri]|uniref:Putative FecR protein n=1 Tax=Methylophaga frappieri (strain ATCC BAA-2434 / DSM 25690 / JAM7) TaxID=754477 RepID=I1YEM7_METFJ|nr:FecR domain-containing protein [Methylophaga frappieri]AFJ01370.1 putative FecR protein [Methylophaga frappieri]
MNHSPTYSELLAGLSHQAMEQAANWYALLGSDGVTEIDRQQWRLWLEKNSENERAWLYVESVSRRFKPLRSTPDPRQAAEGVWEANKRILKRRDILGGLFSLFGVGVVTWSTWRYTPIAIMAEAWHAEYQTEVGEIRDVVLSDGSQLWLNTQTAVSEHFDRQRRRLKLHHGEVLIDTAADANRQFSVVTPHGNLVALGTRFTVYTTAETSLIAVYQGRVSIQPTTTQPIIIEAGQQIRFDSHSYGALENASKARTSWHRRVLVAQNLSLAALVGELRRYRHGHVGLHPDLESLEVFGQFPITQTDETLDMLAEVLPIKIQRTLPWWVTIEPK